MPSWSRPINLCRRGVADPAIRLFPGTLGNIQIDGKGTRRKKLRKFAFSFQNLRQARACFALLTAAADGASVAAMSADRSEHILCCCNSLTEGSIAQAARDGADAASRVFAALDCAPECGRCLARIREIVARAAEAG